MLTNNSLWWHENRAKNKALPWAQWRWSSRTASVSYYLRKRELDVFKLCMLCLFICVQMYYMESIDGIANLASRQTKQNYWLFSFCFLSFDDTLLMDCNSFPAHGKNTWNRTVNVDIAFIRLFNKRFSNVQQISNKHTYVHVHTYTIAARKLLFASN